MTSGFFTCTDGTRLHVPDGADPGAGPGGDLDAPVTVILVHCYGLDHREWDPVLAALDASGAPMRVLRYDQRGYGESGGVTPNTATLAQLGDDLAELIVAQVPAGRVVLAGHSMGGMVIMAMAERYPELVTERVAGVAFVATACAGMGSLSLGLPGPVATIVHGLERAGVWLLSAVRRPVLSHYPRVLEPFARWLVFGEDADRGHVAHVARLLAACRPLTMLLFRPDFDAHDRREALAHLTGSPASVLVGTRDRLTPPRFAAEIAEWLPGAKYVLVEGAGHMLPYERAPQVAAEIAELVSAATATLAVEAS
ncbi:MAG TPA: alpha/beta hydrolase [Pseudonocardiaceae bacterium]|nr:alpha/beta hydrolase [Pseudonocardiaceae bacterium]